MNGPLEERDAGPAGIDGNVTDAVNEKKAAVVAVTGRPSSGKSTLVNRFCGEKVAVTSPVPQTTRAAIRGIVNREQGQLVLVDTPGIHLSGKKLNARLYQAALRQITEADLVLYVLDASRAPGEEEETIAGLLSGRAPLIAAVNKIDKIGKTGVPAADYGRAAAFLEERLPGAAVFPVSALKGEGCAALLDAMFAAAPAGEPLYPAEYYTDQNLDFRVAEIIRGEAINRLREELPHALYVDVADLERRGDGKLWVRAFIVCERESQKGMIVGKGGAMIQAIGKASRRELCRILGWKVELDLRVKTGKDWRHNDASLRRLIDR